MNKIKLEEIAPIKKGDCIEHDKNVWLLNLDMVESNTGRILEYLYVAKEDIGNSTVSFDCTNVLYSKLRPYLNKVVLPTKCGYATSEMLPLKPDTSRITREYLTYFLRSKNFVEYINSKTSGAKMPRANTKDLKNVLVPCPSIKKQTEITATFDKISEMIDLRKIQLEELDSLVKSRFVEMFGNPTSNELKIKTLPMPDVCEIIDGDRGKNYPNQEEFFDNEYCLFLNTKNVTVSGFLFKTVMFITQEKDKKLRKGKLQRGDVILTTRGTIGNLAFYTEDIPYENIRINSGMVIIRMDKTLINEIFFIQQFKMQLDNIKAKIASGSAQPQLPISTMKKIDILIPSIEQQNQFSTFVQQVDKLKLEVKNSLNETQILFDSLMQQYFD